MKLSEIFARLIADEFAGRHYEIMVPERSLSTLEQQCIMDCLEQYCSDVGGGGCAVEAVDRGMNELDIIERYHKDHAEYERKKALADGKEQ